jgi:phosphoribosylglycinamide formyltransferase-1
MQGAVAVADNDTPDTLAARVLDIEHKIYPQALRLLAANSVGITGDTCTTSTGASASRDDTLISPTVI